jgi:hypothetical protein
MSRNVEDDEAFMWTTWHKNMKIFLNLIDDIKIKREFTQIERGLGDSIDTTVTVKRTFVEHSYCNANELATISQRHTRIP